MTFTIPQNFQLSHLWNMSSLKLNVSKSFEILFFLITFSEFTLLARPTIISLFVNINKPECQQLKKIENKYLQIHVEKGVSWETAAVAIWLDWFGSFYPRRSFFDLGKFLLLHPHRRLSSQLLRPSFASNSLRLSASYNTKLRTNQFKEFV